MPSQSGVGYGAFVTKGAKADELLVEIPRAACMTMDTVTNENTYGKAFENLVEKAGPGGNTVALAGLIARERLLGNESVFAPYLRTLPWRRGDNNQEHVLYWDNTEIEELLEGSMCHGEALDLRKEVSIAANILQKILTSQPSFRFPWDPPFEPLPDADIRSAVTAAFVSILSRAFQDGDSEDEKLVPLLDMLQHSETPNVAHAMKESNQAVQVRARVDLEANTELLNQYRSELEENMPYHRFFTRFGFVPGVQEPMVDLLKDKSSIFFAQTAEV